MMKKSTVILLHLGYWLLYALVVSFLFVISSDNPRLAFEDWDDWLIILVGTLLTGLISFYAFYSWLVPGYLTTRKIQKFISWGLVVNIAVTVGIIALITVAFSVLISVVFEKFFFMVLSVKDLRILFIGCSLVSVVNGILGTTIRGFITWYTDIHVRETLANKALRMELALLKAQINPHFLFNTLNNIDILIERDAPRASLYLNKLSDLLRFVLYETQEDQIPLTKELEYIRKYIDLQKIRTTNDQYVTLQIGGMADGVMIPPMLFVPYIENAFKYATNKKVSEAIRIHISINEIHIRFQCVNVIDRSKTASDSQGGLGNDLIRQRLTLLYKEKFTLAIQSTDDDYSVNLLLPVKKHELSPH
jgi:two-component system LytT family sensor kinase